MNQATCPHCGALSAAGAFCQSCGNALPSAIPSGPRIVSGPELASTTAGQKLQGDELMKTAKRARGALLAVAILSTIGIGIVYAILKNLSKLPDSQILAGMIGQVIVAAIFWGLYFWSRYQPLPAAIIGLIAYCTLVVINVVTTLSMAAESRGGFGGIGIGWLDIVIIAILARAISAGAQHRRLLAQAAGGM